MGINFIITKNIDYDYLEKLINFALNNNFTHVRITDDLCNISDNIRKETEQRIRKSFFSSRVYFQDRNDYNKGQQKCYMPLIKPVLGADGNIYPCCGIQYSEQSGNLNYSKNNSMGNDINDIWDNQKTFNGLKCKQCYNDSYNRIIDSLSQSKNLIHKEFI